MVEKKFRFYFQDSVTNEYYIYSGGIVTTTPVETPLLNPIYTPNTTQSPENWEQTEVQWARSKIYWGLYRNFSTSFRFHGQAGKIIKWVFCTVGTTAKVRLIIKKFNGATNITAYEDWYSGDLDFIKCVPTWDGVDIPVKESGLRDLFTQNENVVYEHELDDDAIDAGLYGLKLRAKMAFLGIDNDVVTQDGETIFPPINFISSEGDYIVGLSNTVSPQVGTNADPTNWFFKSTATQQVEVEITGHVNAAWTPVSGLTVITDPATILLRLQVFTDDSGLAPPIATDFLINASQSTLDGVVTYNLNTTVPFSLVEGNVLRLSAIAQYSGAGYTNNPFGFSTFDDLRITVRSTFSLPFSKCKAFTEPVMMGRVVNQMTNGLYSADLSFWLGGVDIVESRPEWTVYTSGDAIRQISLSTGELDKIKITPFDFFDNIMKDWGGGIGIINNRVVFNRKEFFLDKNTSLLDLREVSSLEVTAAEDLLYNYIEAGNSEQEYDYLNGKDEIMNKSKYKTALTKVATWDLVRPLRHDIYGIETTRYSLFQKDTTDNRADNNVFSWEIDNGFLNGAYLLRRSQNDFGNSATGVLFAETKYNFSKSPLRVVLRNSSFLKGMLYFNLTEDVVFQSTEKNANLATLINGNGLFEKFNIDLENTPFVEDVDPLFIPLYLKVRHTHQKNLFSTLNANPNGYFDFTYRGVALKGFPMETGAKEGRPDEYETVMLCHPEVDPEDIYLALTKSEM